MRTLTGTIQLVQESRFRLVTETGQSKLFVLSHAAALAPEDLPPLQRAQARVTVSFTPARGLYADIAHRIREADSPTGDAR